MNIGMNQFIDGGSDVELLKSLAGDGRYDGDELSKALNRSGLVQVQTQVQGKHGTYTRMQWKKASDVKSTDKVVGGQNANPEKTPGAEAPVGRFSDMEVSTGDDGVASLNFTFQGEKYKLAEGKTLTFTVKTSAGTHSKISGPLKLTDGGYARVGAYPLGGMDNVVAINTKCKV